MKGNIQHEQAYAQGKMLDHSKWFGVLPRGITPSDCDMQVFDNDGNILLVEFSSRNNSWGELSKGQRWGYESLVKLGAASTKVCIAALCNHSVPSDSQICTYGSVETFAVMVPCRGGAGVVTTFHPYLGDRWVKFVLSFFQNPGATLQSVYRHIDAGN